METTMHTNQLLRLFELSNGIPNNAYQLAVPKIVLHAWSYQLFWAATTVGTNRNDAYEELY
jgi:hypothetical protein